MWEWNKMHTWIISAWCRTVTCMLSWAHKLEPCGAWNPCNALYQWKIEKVLNKTRISEKAEHWVHISLVIYYRLQLQFDRCFYTEDCHFTHFNSYYYQWQGNNCRYCTSDTSNEFAIKLIFFYPHFVLKVYYSSYIANQKIHSFYFCIFHRISVRRKASQRFVAN